MQEIMILRKNVDNETRLKTFLVDETTLSKLTRIRGTLYEDNPRLKLARDLPTPEPKIEITPEMQARAEAAFQRYLAEKTPTKPVTQPQPPQPKRPLTPEEEWRTRPDIRSEFISLTSYEAYCKAAESGRCKIYGVKT